MAKLIGHFKRREGMTSEEFREYYETRHAPLGTSLFGHLWTSYTRNYAAVHLDAEGSPVEATFDVVTEIVFADDEAAAEMFRITADDPSVRERVVEDEARFMDRGASRIVLVTDHVTG